MDFKKILKKVLPEKVLRFFQNIKMLNYRLSVIEQEMKNFWILDKSPGIKDQREMLRRKEFKIFSQTGEDGIINHIFEKIGTIKALKPAMHIARVRQIPAITRNTIQSDVIIAMLPV